MAEPEAEAKYEVQSATIRATANSSSSVLRQSPVEITLLPLTSGISSESRPLVTDSSSHTTTSSTIPSTAHTTSSSLRSTSDVVSSLLHTPSSTTLSLVEAAFSPISTGSYRSPVLQTTTTSSLSAVQTASTGNSPVIETVFISSATSGSAQLEAGTTKISSILPQFFTETEVVTSGSLHTLVTVTLSGPGSVTRSTSTVSVTATPNDNLNTHPSLSIPIAISVGGFVCLLCVLMLAIRLRHHSRSSRTDIEPLVEAEESKESRDQGSDGISISGQVIDIFEALDDSSHISSRGEIQCLLQQLDQLSDRVEQMRLQGTCNSISVERGNNQDRNDGRTDTDPDPDATPPL